MTVITSPNSSDVSTRIIESLLGLLEAMIDSLRRKPVRTIAKFIVLSWFNYLAVAFILFTSILLFYALYTNTDGYKFNQAKKFLIRKYGSDWTKHMDELQPFDYPVSDQSAIN